MFSLGEVILCCLISAAVGYFWAMWRVDNIKIMIENNVIKLDMKRFWEQAEAWRSRQEK